ncbi:MAG: glycerophosphodiester phosphodiesterase family protein [Myxococcota bacterium]
MRWAVLGIFALLVGCSSEPSAGGQSDAADAGAGADAVASDANDSGAGSLPDAAGPDADPAADAGDIPDARDIPDTGSTPDAGLVLDATSALDATAQADAGQAPDAGQSPDAGQLPDAGQAPDAGYLPTLRNSLGICWTDPTCQRRMSVGHGGDWNALSAPYDSSAAIAQAYMNDMDGVKIDVRVTMDNVPVIAHSSPIEAFESLDCINRRIEQMTAAEVTGCHRLPSRTETFQRLDDVLNYLRGKMVAQLTVKLSTDYARTIEVIHTLGAEDFTFLEISTSELQNQIPTIPGSDTIWYLINVTTNYSEVDTLIDTIHNPRAFMIELDLGAPVMNLISSRIHPAGLKAFTYDSSATAGVQELLDLYNQGFDVVSTQRGSNGVQARRQANMAGGQTPP